MPRKKEPSRFGTLLAGAALGAGATAAVGYWLSKSPQTTPAQIRRNRALDHALSRARATEAVTLQPGQRYVIFSDLHKGRRTPADEFRFCEATYLAALEHYYKTGYTLVILGDAEELWEEPDIGAVVQANVHVLESEARFHPGRYVRVDGNHDNAWRIEHLVKQHLDPIFPGIQVRREFLIKAPLEGDKTGEILMVHGHQGTLDSDIFDFLPPRLLPFYRDFQNITDLGHTSPSRDDCLRGLQDTFLYRWASAQADLILIAGHTHRPVWTSLTHLDSLQNKLRYLQSHRQGYQRDERLQKMRTLLAEIEERERKYPPCNDTIKTRSCYFNTGCCVFKDGDITGIEIDGGTEASAEKDGQLAEMRLVKWGKPAGDEPEQARRFVRQELESRILEEIFLRLYTRELREAQPGEAHE
jgi:UDP-2,3-diacylglucosamine pyrophosphatase LpxH